MLLREVRQMSLPSSAAGSTEHILLSSRFKNRDRDGIVDTASGRGVAGLEL